MYSTGSNRLKYGLEALRIQLIVQYACLAVQYLVLVEQNRKGRDLSRIDLENSDTNIRTRKHLMTPWFVARRLKLPVCFVSGSVPLFLGGVIAIPFWQFCFSQCHHMMAL